MTLFLQGQRDGLSDAEVYADEVRLLDFAGRIGADGFMGVFSYGQMPHAEAARSLELLAREVLPALQKETMS
jgi:hypothetical protein